MNMFITGAAGGLGRAMAVECGKRGYNLFLTDVNEDGLRQMQTGLERRFDIAVTAKACDLTDSSSVDELLKTADAFGLRFDMLLNIAGVDFEGGFITREREQIVKIVMLNDAATLRITHAILSRRRPNKRFAIVFVSSLASLFPMPLKATYAASIRFILDFATALREELAEQNATVLTLCPAGMVTKNDTIEAINAQGFFGAATTNALELVAKNTVTRALNGDAVYIPGGLNRSLAAIGKLLPRAGVAKIICMRWRKTQKKWLTESICGTPKT